MTNQKRHLSRRLGLFRAGCYLLLLLVLLDVWFLHAAALKTRTGWSENASAAPAALTEFVASL